MKQSTLNTKITTICGHTLDVKARYYAPNSTLSNSILICLPGGGSSRQYFDLGEFGGYNYSFAKRMTDLGHQVLSLDHLGTGENPIPKDMDFLTPRDAAMYLAWALDEFFQDLPVDGKNVIGIGHSMGGMIITLLSYYEGYFTAIGLFGSSAGGLDWGLTEAEKAYIEKPDDFEREIEKLTLAKFGVEFIKTSSGPSGKSITFGGETPELTQRLRDIGCELYAAGGMMSMTRGSFRKEVEAIDVPVFFAFGDHDIGIPPQDVPKDYINTPSTELIVLENTGHNHFAFSSIAKLCTRLDQWAQDWKS